MQSVESWSSAMETEYDKVLVIRKKSDDRNGAVIGIVIQNPVTHRPEFMTTDYFCMDDIKDLLNK